MADPVKEALGELKRMSGMGDGYAAMQTLFYGINHRGVGIPITPNSDHFGLTFFTRPDLNLSYDNCDDDDRLKPYILDETGTSLKAACRAYLDPRGQQKQVLSTRGSKEYNLGSLKNPPKSHLVDVTNPFIPLMSNLLTSMSGWPDMVADTYTSTPGVYREEQSMVDGVSEDFSAFDISANFKNIAGDPITLLFNLWYVYYTRVYSGEMMPYPKNIIANRIDYNTKIFRLVLDPTRTYVTKMATTIAFPTSVSMGAAFNFDNQKPTSEENSQIAMNFKCNGVQYNSMASVFEFNRLMGVYDPAFQPSVANDYTKPLMGVARGTHRKVDAPWLDYMNFKGKPIINPATMELEYYAPKELFEQALYKN